MTSARLDGAAVLWSRPEGDRPGRDLVVLLHGHRSRPADLFDRLTPLLPGPVVVAAPRGPVTIGRSYSWVSDEARRTTVADDAVAAVGTAVARSVLAWLADRPPFRSVGLVGVSQGACIAFQGLRAAPTRFAYVVNLSGYVLPGTEAGDAVLRRNRPPVFWGRGRHDAVVPVAYVERTSRWLDGHSTLTERVYDLGHTESDDELAEAAAFIDRARSARP